MFADNNHQQRESSSSSDPTFGQGDSVQDEILNSLQQQKEIEDDREVDYEINSILS